MSVTRLGDMYITSWYTGAAKGYIYIIVALNYISLRGIWQVLVGL